MCRSMTENGDLPYYPRERDRLKIKAFHLRLSAAAGCGGSRPLPEALTLVYLPRINGNPLEVNGAKIRPDAPTFVALHRTRTAEPEGGAEAVFASTDRVRAGDGVRFEAYVGAERVVKGVFRRGGGGWGMECRRAAEVDGDRLGVSAAEVCVAGERGVVMRERVEMAAARRRGRRRFCLRLEEIPEEGEEDSDGCDCCCCEGREEEEEEWEVVGSDGRDWGERDGTDGGDGMEMEGVSWAVDLGIWVMCLGVGILVSRASYKGWRRKLI